MVGADPGALQGDVKSAVGEDVLVDVDDFGCPLEPWSHAVVKLAVDLANNVRSPSVHPPVAVQMVQDYTVMCEDDQCYGLSCVQMLDELLWDHDGPEECNRHLTFVDGTIIHPYEAFPERAQSSLVHMDDFLATRSLLAQGV